LYEKGKQQRQTRKYDRKQVEIEYEKQKEECTFKPKFVATKNLKFMGKGVAS
jgi:hypothetical protein